MPEIVIIVFIIALVDCHIIYISAADIEYRGRFLSDYRSEIYYHRELLIKSVEGRRIDLLTITSFDKILEQKEELLPNLFVDETCPRCNKFSEKKVVCDE